MSFLNKLKQNIEEVEPEVEPEKEIVPEEEKEKIEKIKEKPSKLKSRRKKKVKVKDKEEEPVLEQTKKPSETEELLEKEMPKEIEKKKKKWFKSEGELAVDVYQTEKNIVIQSAIAGVKSEDLDISIENDNVVIKGVREKPEQGEEKSYFYQECYWGPFSKRIILPEEVDNSRAEAELKQGILTISIPKIQRKTKRKIAVKN